MRNNHTTDNSLNKLTIWSVHLKKILLVLILLVIFIGAPTKLKSQVMGAPVSTLLNDQLRWLFHSITPPNPQPPVFYDMSVHFSSKDWWVPENQDTSATTNFVAIYDEMYTAHYDTTQFLRVDTVLRRSLKYGADTVIVGLIDYRYCSLVDSAMYDTTYFHIDTTNSSGPFFIDNPNATSTPYDIKSVYTVCALPQNNSSGDLVFAVDPDFLFLEGDKEQLYDADDLRLEIDFGDGNGWIPFPTSSVSFHPVSYVVSGVHILRARTVDPRNTNDSIINFSLSRISSPKSDLGILPDEIWTDIPGMKVEVYWGCDPTAGQDFEPKFIIWMPGFDFVERKEKGKRYKQYFNKAGLGDLRNYGYHVLMVDWNNSKDSVQNNALKIPALISKLKCTYLDQFSDPQHQFVMIGSSLGAIIARYALAWMEQNPNFSSCFPNLHHNTRLFISLDGEYQGAYYPLAIQQLYNHPGALYGAPADVFHSLWQRYNALNSPAAHQLMAFHTASQDGNEYGPHQARLDLLDDFNGLNGNGGYPEHVKMIAIGNGLFTGEHQTGLGDSCIMEPGHLYLGYHKETSMTVLGQILNAGAINLELKALEEGEDFFLSNVTKRKWRLQLQWINWQQCLPPFNWPCWNVPIPNGVAFEPEDVQEDSLHLASEGVPLIDIMPGSRVNGEAFIGQVIPNDFTLMTPDWFGLSISLNAFQSQEQANSDCPQFNFVDYHFQGLGFEHEISISSQGLNACYVPNFSAIDYQADEPLDLDLYSEDIDIKLANTPFDVIIGEVNGLPGYPDQVRTHAPWLPSSVPDDLDFPSLNRPHPRMINHLLPDTFMLADTNQTKFARYLNREIGDEELFLENIDFDRQGLFRAATNIAAGVNLNPFYEYPSQSASGIFRTYTNQGWEFNQNDYGYNIQSNGIFSKEDPFHVTTSSFALLMAEDSASTTGAFNEGTLNTQLMAQVICNLAYCDTTYYSDTSNKKGDEQTQNVSTSLSAAVYPNPVMVGETLKLTSLAKGNYSINLTTIDGRVCQRIAVHAMDESELLINVSTELSPGLYVLTLIGEGRKQHFKITVL